MRSVAVCACLKAKGKRSDGTAPVVRPAFLTWALRRGRIASVLRVRYRAGRASGVYLGRVYGLGA